MPERDGYIPGVPCWVDTSQPDPEAAVTFYRGLFGWEFEDTMPPGSEGRYFVARLRGGDVAAVGSSPDGAPAAAAWNTYIWVESADETASRVREAGGRILMEPFDVTDAGRMAVFADPEGAAFSVWQPGRHKGSQIVNEPGSVNFNGLHTRDVEAAKRFYGSVFGWGTLTIGGAELWTLPGYGDHLEEREPGLRQRLAEFGAEPGFEDVVASINPIGDDQARRPRALERDVLDRRRGPARRQGRRAGRQRARPADGRPLGQDDRDHRPAGSVVHRDQVRARERRLGLAEPEGHDRPPGQILARPHETRRSPRSVAHHHRGNAGRRFPAGQRGPPEKGVIRWSSCRSRPRGSSGRPARPAGPT